MQRTKIPKVVFIDDNAEVLDLLIQTAKVAGFRARGFHSAEEFIDAQEWLDVVDCLVVDHRLPGMSGEQLLTYLVERKYAAPIILVTGYGDVPAAVRAIKLGAADYILKPVDDATLIHTITATLRATPSVNSVPHTLSPDAINKLTERQQEVLALVGEGLTSKQIAQKLNVSHRTVEVHRAHIMKVLSANSAADLIRMSILNRDALARLQIKRA